MQIAPSIRVGKMVNFRFGVGVAFLLACFSIGISSAQPNRIIDSLRSSLTGIQNDTTRIKTLNELGGYFINVGRYDSAKQYLLIAKKSADKINFESELALSLTRLGILSENLSAYMEALAYYGHALKIRKKLRNDLSVADILANTGIVYSALGDYEKATSLYIQACEIYNRLGNKFGVANTELSIGNICYFQKNYGKALEYYLLSLKTHEELNDKFQVALIQYNIALIHIEREQYDLALTYCFKSLKLAREIDDKEGVASTLNGIGLSYKKKGDFKRALLYYVQGVEQYEQLQNKMRVAEGYQLIGVLYDSMKDHKKALQYFNRQLSIAEGLSGKRSLRSAYKSLSDHFGQSKDFPNAYKYQKLFEEVNDSLLSEETVRLIAESEGKYQNEKKKKEIDLLQKDSKIKLLVINENRIQIIGLAVAILFLLVFAWLLLQRNKLRSRQKLDAEILRQQDLGLAAVLEAQETERQRIAKDLHDGVGQQLVGLKLSVQDAMAGQKNAMEIPVEKSTRINKILDEVAQEVRSISHQMMPGALVESGLIPALEDMLNKSFSKSVVSYHFEHSNISERFDKSIETNLYRISQELTQNIYKHSGATEVNIQLFKSQNRLILMMEDNGIGMKSEGNDQKGMGLLNITARVKSMKGELSIEPGPFAGTVITIRIPVE